MGAQGEHRLKNYRKRFREWEDPSGNESYKTLSQLLSFLIINPLSRNLNISTIVVFICRRKNPSILLWYSLFFCYDCSFIFNTFGTVHATLSKVAGKLQLVFMFKFFLFQVLFQVFLISFPEYTFLWSLNL